MVYKNGAQDEAKRHNAALEKRSEETTEYNVKQEKNQDRLNTEIARKHEAGNELHAVKEPVLDYVPSDDQQKYELAFIGLETAVAVGVAVKNL